jgi:hypothetical protein
MVVAAPKRTRLQREEDLATTARLNRRGYELAEIGRIVGVSQVQICYDLKKLRQRYYAEQKRLVAEELSAKALKVAEKVDQYKEIRRELWEQWEISKGHVERDMIEKILEVLEEEGGVQGITNLRIQLSTKPIPEYIRLILTCLEAERELEGLDEPKKLDARVVSLDWDRLLDAGEEDHRDRIEDRITRARGLGNQARLFDGPSVPTEGVTPNPENLSTPEIVPGPTLDAKVVYPTQEEAPRGSGQEKGISFDEGVLELGDEGNGYVGNGEEDEHVG